MPSVFFFRNSCMCECACVFPHVVICRCVPACGGLMILKIILTLPPYPLRERLSVKPSSLVWLDTNQLVWGFPISTFPGHNYKQAAIAIQHFYGKC